jgi:hypothetical protein
MEGYRHIHTTVLVDELRVMRGVCVRSCGTVKGEGTGCRLAWSFLPRSILCGGIWLFAGYMADDEGDNLDGSGWTGGIGWEREGGWRDVLPGWFLPGLRWDLSGVFGSVCFHIDVVCVPYVRRASIFSVCFAAIYGMAWEVVRDER